MARQQLTELHSNVGVVAYCCFLLVSPFFELSALTVSLNPSPKPSPCLDIHKTQHAHTHTHTTWRAVKENYLHFNKSIFSDFAFYSFYLLLLQSPCIVCIPLYIHRHHAVRNALFRSATKSWIRELVKRRTLQNRRLRKQAQRSDECAIGTRYHDNNNASLLFLSFFLCLIGSHPHLSL